MQQETKIFADGFSFKRSENAPDFVIGRLSMKVDEAISFVKQNEKKGWINLNVKQARSGNYYVELDTFEPKGADKSEPAPASKPKTKAVKQESLDDDDGSLPF